MFRHSPKKFIAAAEKGDLVELEAYLALNKDNPHKINVQDSYGNTALMRATLAGQLPAVKVLLAVASTDPNLANNKGYNPLIIAIDCKYPAITECLRTDPRININHKCANGSTPLMYAAFIGDISTVSYLLAQNNIQVNDRAPNGNTAFMYAALQGHALIVDTFLRDGRAHINLSNNNGDTALIMAAYKGQRLVVEFLLYLPRTNIYAINHKGHTAAIAAEINEHKELADYLAAREIEALNETVTDETKEEVKPQRSSAQPSQALKINFRKRLDKLGFTKEDEAKIPEHFICPISNDLMNDPITLSTGHTYDRSSLIQWAGVNLNKQGQFNCPLSKKLVPCGELRNDTNWGMNKLIEKFVASEEKKAKEAQEMKNSEPLSLRQADTSLPETKNQAKSGESSEERQTRIRLAGSPQFKYALEQQRDTQARSMPEVELVLSHKKPEQRH